MFSFISSSTDLAQFGPGRERLCVDLLRPARRGARARRGRPSARCSGCSFALASGLTRYRLVALEASPSTGPSLSAITVAGHAHPALAQAMSRTPPRAAQWFGLLAAPLAWALQLVFGLYFAEAHCEATRWRPAGRPPQLALTLPSPCSWRCSPKPQPLSSTASCDEVAEDAPPPVGPPASLCRRRAGRKRALPRRDPP